MKPLGDFEEWREVMGGLLGYHGYGGFLADRDALRTEHAAADVMQLAFLGLWWQDHQTNRQHARDLVPLATHAGLDLGNPDDGQAAKRLGWRLHDLLGQPVRPLLDNDQRGPLVKVASAGLLDGTETWQLLVVEEEDNTRNPLKPTADTPPSSNQNKRSVGFSDEAAKNPLNSVGFSEPPPENQLDICSSSENETASAVGFSGFEGAYPSSTREDRAESPAHAWQCRACKAELTSESELLRGLHTYCLEPVPW